MSRDKGTPKTGGRQAGTPNKVTKTLKEFVAEIIDGNREQIEKDLKSLRPKERLNVIVGLMQYVLPKQQSVRADVERNDLCKDLVIRCVYDPIDRTDFPSSESEVDLERDPRWYKKTEND